MESKFVQTRDIRLHYLDWGGKGPPAVLIHGTGFCAHVWMPLAKALSSRFRVLAIDLRGHGDSDRAEGRYSWEHVSGDLPAFIDALELDNVLLVGHSRGGGVAAIGGAQRVDRVSRAVLIEPTLPFGPRPAARPGAGNPGNSLAEGARRRRGVWDSREQMFQSYRNRGPFKNWREDILRSYVEGGTREIKDGRVELKCPPEVEAQFFEGRPSAEMLDAMSQITFPVLLMTGGNQSIVPATSPAIQAMERSAASFRHITVPDAGHFLPQEQPEVMEKAIWEFVSDKG